MPGLIRTQSIVDISGTYSTTFAGGDENPLSEGGRWINGAQVGLDWGNFRNLGHKAVGTLAIDFHDNTSILTGNWPNNQYGQGTVWRGSPAGGDSPEVEVRLRTVLTPHVCSGYEIGFSLQTGSSAYLIIVRWNGPVSSFDYLLRNTGSQYQVNNGDVVRAEIQGNIISAFRNGSLLASVDITSIGGTVYTTGAPGIGHNIATGGTDFDQFGFTSFSAGAL